MFIKDVLKLRKAVRNYNKEINKRIEKLEAIPIKQKYVFEYEAEQAVDIITGKYMDIQNLIPETSINKWKWSELFFNMYMEAMIKLETICDKREELELKRAEEGIEERGLIIPFPSKREA